MSVLLNKVPKTKTKTMDAAESTVRSVGVDIVHLEPVEALPASCYCWSDAVVMVNYEAHTLPLLFASQSDYRAYYDTMRWKHPRRVRPLTALQALGDEARIAKAEGRLVDVVALLSEGLQQRKLVFSPQDYQITATQEHLLWSAIHLAVLAHTHGDSRSALHLFRYAAQRIREVSKRQPVAPSTEGGGGLDMTLAPAPASQCPTELSSDVLQRLSFVLHFNWGSYYAKHGRWGAARQQCEQADKLWTRITKNPHHAASTQTEEVSALVASRVATCAAMTATFPNKSAVVKRFATLCAADVDPPPNFSVRPLNSYSIVLAPPQLSQSQEGEGVAPSAQSPLPVEFTLCLSSQSKEVDSSWPIRATASFCALFALARVCHDDRRFQQATAYLDKCERMSELFAATGAPANAQWLDSVSVVRAYSAHNHKCDLVPSFALPSGLTRSTQVQEAAKLVCQQVLKGRNGRAAGNAGDETTRQWEELVQLFERNVPAAKAARMVPQERMLSPLEVVRQRAASRNTDRLISTAPTLPSHVDSPPHTSAIATKKLQKSVKRREEERPRPATVLGTTQSIYCEPAHTMSGLPRLAHAEIKRSLPTPQQPRKAAQVGTEEDIIAAALNDSVPDGALGPACTTEMLLERERRKYSKLQREHTKLLESQKASQSRISMLEKMVSVEKEHETCNEPVAKAEGAKAPPMRGFTPVSGHFQKQQQSLNKSEQPQPSKKRFSSSIKCCSNSVSLVQHGAATLLPPCGAEEDIVPDTADIRKKQKQLRAVLSQLDAHDKTYRMVVQQLAANEKVLQEHRNELHRKKIERNAEKIAKRAGIAGAWKSFHNASKSQTESLEHSHNTLRTIEPDKDLSNAAAAAVALEALCLIFSSEGAEQRANQSALPPIPAVE